MTTATRNPTESDINDALAAAIEAVQDARWMLEAVGHGIGDDLRSAIRDVEATREWTTTNPGWTTAPF